jgi:hypothetical protein
MTKTGFKPIQALLRESDGIAPVHTRLVQLSRLQQSVADALPPGFGDACRVATVEGSTLVIAVANGAVAAKLSRCCRACLRKFLKIKSKNKRLPELP